MAPIHYPMSYSTRSASERSLQARQLGSRAARSVKVRPEPKNLGSEAREAPELLCPSSVRPQGCSTLFTNPCMRG